MINAILVGLIVGLSVLGWTIAALGVAWLAFVAISVAISGAIKLVSIPLRAFVAWLAA